MRKRRRRNKRKRRSGSGMMKGLLHQPSLVHYYLHCGVVEAKMTGMLASGSMLMTTF